MQRYRTPGVYREDVFPAPTAELRTGVPAFLGYAREAREETNRVPVNEARPLTLWSQFVQHFGQPLPNSYLAYAVRGFFENGGRLCYVVRLDETVAVQKALDDGLVALEPLDAIDLLCAPDLMVNSDPDKTPILQQKVLDHCEQAGDRFAILDALYTHGQRGEEAIKQVHDQRAQLSGTNGALYFPWIGLAERDEAGKITVKHVPPCGHVAGVYARSDERIGVHKAPANEELAGVLDLACNLPDAQQGPLNEQGVNCLRAFPGRGIRVWGARTLSREPAWTYVNVRRLFLTAGRWIERAMAGVVLEPNDFRLWVRIERELRAYFGDLFRRGALRGSTEEEAFYVKCDAETNPPQVQEAGMVVTEIGLAPAIPNEFVVVRIIHGASGVTIAGPTRPE
ncbi:MAG: phage tail sheath family protein [Anaerolineae bacterium]|nr:MAG: phage tail sheath family protein [Anaerolineae bacterium]